MGKPTGFLEYKRVDRSYQPIAERITHYHEFVLPLSEEQLQYQGARCMDCGIPFCHQGCPVNNIIPDWNDLVYRSDWQKAIEILHSTNNFPEFTGRICPAPCQESCTLNLQDVPVTIKTIECAIVDKAWQQNWIKPVIPEHRTGKQVAVIGSGPAGLACAQQLARAGHDVTVFEKADRIGGLLRYGIPDFKLNKALIDRRVAQMRAEGVEFHLNTHIGRDISVEQLQKQYHAIVFAGGSEQPRDLNIPGRELKGIHFAMEFLTANSKWVQKVPGAEANLLSAEHRHVVVIGGGDTGSDCVGTANRHGAKTITQIELMPKPPIKEQKALVWPDWPHKLRISTSQEEGCEQMWSVLTQSFIGENGQVKGLRCVKVDWQKDEQGRWQMNKIPNSEFELKADLVLLAMGFVHPVHTGMIEQSGVELDERGNIKASTEGKQAYHSSVKGIFSAGDMRRGQSLVVWAIREGRQCARAVDIYLMGQSHLPKE